MARSSRYALASAALLAAVLLGSAAYVASCPFCSAVSMTLTEEMSTNDMAVIARLASRPELPENKDGDNPVVLPIDSGQCQFEIVQILKGEDVLKDKKQIEVLYFGDQPIGSNFLIFGIDPTNPSWATPTPLSDRALEYVAELPKLPQESHERLLFFQKYFEDKDALLAADAYDEFARAPYADVQAIKDDMDHDQLLAWVQDPEVTPSRRRLYLTMLGVCGTPDDVPILQGMIESEERSMRTALDALIACYLNLQGAEGVALIEDLFLKNPDSEYTDTYSAIMALRFHVQETDIIPKERVLAALRHMLDRPQLADLVIPDLARWQDWSVMEKVVELFKNADEGTTWVRVPVINYLRACPDPKAAEYIEELAQIDPDAVKRANQFYPTGGALAGQPANTVPSNFTRAGSEAEKKKNQSADESGEPATPADATAEKSAQPGDKKAGEQPAEPAANSGAAVETPAAEEADDNSQAAAVPVTPPSDSSDAAAPAAAAVPAVKASEVLLPAGIAAVALAALFLVILKGSRSGRAV